MGCCATPLQIGDGWAVPAPQALSRLTDQKPSIPTPFVLAKVTNSVTFDLVATQTAEGIAVNGSIPVTFADYGIDDPSFGPAEVEDSGEIEVLLVLTQS